VQRSRYYTWAVYDVENWSGRSAVDAASIQRALRRIEAAALAAAGIDPARVARQPRGDGAILALPGDIAKEAITSQFVEGLREGVSDHDAGCAPGESIRVRLSLHAGDVLEGDGEWAGQPVVIAARLVDSALLKRVLAAAIGSPLALIVSGEWYDAVVREGYASGAGYQEVWVAEKSFAGRAWVAVPGRTRPPGLTPGDAPGPAAAPPPPGSGRADGHAGRAASSGRAARGPTIRGNAVLDSTINGDVVFGSKSVGAEPEPRGDKR
jgi:hypothetical protein